MELEASYYVKPMNCPFHIQIYKSDRAPTATCPSAWPS